jgi:hypothetical protein
LNNIDRIAERPDEFREAVSPFLKQHGFEPAFELSLLRGGANNRVYRISDSRRSAVLKHYFKNPSDPRDRFRAESAFYAFLWARGIRRTPEPLAWDSELRLGLLSFIDGRKLRAAEVNSGAVNQAIDFILELNQSRTDVAQIPVASEACFSIAEHLDCIQNRVVRLQTIQSCTEIDAQAIAFIREQLEPAWDEVRSKISRAALPGLDHVLPAGQRYLSPSDFGFHNALLSADGKLRFFDFEYAGWDDPAKLTCDFFCQPELPIGREHWQSVLDTVSRAFSEPLGGPATLPTRTSHVEQAGKDAGAPRLADRAALLLPAYQIKWCCIMLNDFVRSEQARRQFAAGGAVDRKAIQLEKAMRALGSMEK